MNESYLQFSLGLHPTAILFLHVVQYVVLGPRIKNYNLEFPTSRAEIFPEDNFYGSRDHLKVASSKRKYFSCNSKKGDPVTDNFRTMRILTIFYLFFIILDISKLPSSVGSHFEYK